MIYEDMTREQLLEELRSAKDEITQLRWSVGTRELKTTSSVFPGMVSERRYRSLFENIPVAIWEEDFSSVKNYLDNLRKAGIRDFKNYFTQNPDEVLKCITLARIIDINQAAVDLYQSGTKEAFFRGLNQIIPEESMGVMRDEFTALAEGKTEFKAEMLQRTFDERKIHVILRLVIAPGHEYDWSRVLVTIIDITERKKAEEDVRRSQERYQLSAKGANDGLWDWDVVTNEVYFSPRWKAMIGFNDQEFPNKFIAFEKAIHPEDHDRAMKALKDYLQGKAQIYQAEFRMCHKDGSYRWMLARAAAIWDQNGIPLRIAGSHMDITERKASEVLLARRAAELATVAEVSTAVSTILEVKPMLQSVVDLTQERFRLSHVHVYLVNHSEKVLELTAASGDSLEQVPYEKRLVFLEDEDQLVARAGTSRSGVIRNYLQRFSSSTQDGSSELAVPMIVGGTLLGVLKVQSSPAGLFTQEDIQIHTTLASQVAVALQNARQYEKIQMQQKRFRDVALASADWVFETDAGACYTYCSDRVRDVLGYSPDEMIGKNFIDLLPEDERPRLRSALKEALRTSSSLTDLETHQFTRDGRPVIISTTAVPFLDEQGLMLGYRGVNKDVTGKRKADELLVRRAEELATVAELSTSVSTILDPQKMLQSVVDLVKERFELYHAHIYLLDETGETLVLASGSGEIGRRMVAEQRRIALDTKRSIVARAARTQQSIIANDTHINPDFLPHPLLPNTASELAVPLIVGSGLIGVLDVQSDSVGSFLDEDAMIFLTLASQVAVALQNARQYALIQKKAEQEALVNTISERIQAASTVENALKVAVRELGQALGAELTTVELTLTPEENTGR